MNDFFLYQNVYNSNNNCNNTKKVQQNKGKKWNRKKLKQYEYKK